MEIEIIVALQGHANDFFVFVTTAMSYLTGWIGFVCLLFFMFVLLKNKGFVLSFGLTYGVASAVCHSLKAIIKRERPFVASNSVVNMLPANGFSMPSGHSVSAAVITTFLLYLIISSNLKKRTKAVLGTLTSLILPLVMLSRMFLGQHYLSDTIVGAVIGVAIAIGGIFVFRFVSRRFLNGHRKNS